MNKMEKIIKLRELMDELNISMLKVATDHIEDPNEKSRIWATKIVCALEDRYKNKLTNKKL